MLTWTLLAACSAARICLVDQLDGDIALVETPERGLWTVALTDFPGPPSEGDAFPCDALPQGADVVANQGASRRPVPRALAQFNHQEEKR